MITADPHANEGPYTWEDFIALEEDDLRELIDGELVEVEVPEERHEHVIAALIVLLGTWARAGAGGRVLGSGYKVRISQKRGLMPDVQFYRAGNRSAVTQQMGLVEGVPDLVVEVISPISSRRYDRVKKLQWYAARRVPEYWIVDPEARTIEQLVLTGETYAIASSNAEDEVFRPATFPGLELALAELWSLENPAPNDG